MECKKMKKIISAIVVLLFSSILFAQVNVDPNHSFYKDAQKWETYGLIKGVPPVRPYPLNVIKDILQQVIDSEDEIESEVAKEYWLEVTGKPFNFALEIGMNYKRSDDNYVAAVFLPKVYGTASLLNDWLGVGYKIGFAGYTKKAGEYLNTFNPAFTFLERDTLQDPGEIWKFQFYLDTNDNISVGNKNFFLQAGINRLGYGSFLGQGIALNESSYHMANIAFTVLQDKWNFSMLYAALGASKNYDGTGLMADKYLAFHQIEVKINPVVSLAYYENIVFGKRFDFSYLIPAPYMAIQGLGGCNDNLQMGIKVDVKPISGLLWATDLFVDDVSFNDLIKFNFDTKLRIAATTGVIWNPKNSIFSNIGLKYTLVTPYTYSHWDFDDDVAQTIRPNTYNYQAYNTNGISIGSLLPPNSDQIRASFDLKPIKNLDLSFNLGFARHGNISETLPADEALYYILAKDKKTYATDGTINQHPIIGTNDNGNNRDNYLSSAWNKLNFLNQNHKMYYFQGGIDASYIIGKWKWGSFSVKASYNAEFIMNKGVDTNLYEAGLTVKNNDGTYTYNGIKYNNAEDLVNAYKEKWASTFTNQFNNYFYIGVEYKW